jgi:SAM-dependent methyltransferase
LAKELESEQLNSSATLHMFLKDPKPLFHTLSFLDRHLIRRGKIVDLGGGYGFLTKLVADLLGFKEAYNIDIDENRLKKSWVRSIKLNLEYEPLPFRDKEIDLVMSFGALDHMVLWDNIFLEAYRVLKPQHYLIISLTNLGSWDTRLSLLFGFQPRHIEVSGRSLVGVHRFGLVSVPVGHVHTCTYKAMKELATFYGFKVCFAKGLKTTHPNRFIRIIDTVMAQIPSLATRYLVVLEKCRE